MIIHYIIELITHSSLLEEKESSSKLEKKVEHLKLVLILSRKTCLV